MPRTKNPLYTIRVTRANQYPGDPWYSVCLPNGNVLHHVRRVRFGRHAYYWQSDTFLSSESMQLRTMRDVRQHALSAYRRALAARVELEKMFEKT